MAVALRPAVALIALASLLFIVTGWLDSANALAVSSVESWIFGAVNLLVALLIARGNERILALRIGLAAFFMVERPVTAVVLGPTPIESIALHLVTALVEAVIFVSTMRVWRLGHSVSEADLAFLTLPSVSSPLAATAGSPAETLLTAPPPAPGPTTTPAAASREPRARSGPAEGVAPLLSRRSSYAIGLLSLLLAIALVADAAGGGIVSGVTVDLTSTWLAYVLALVLLAVAVRAVHGRPTALRLMLVVALITFVERAFTLFAVPVSEAVSLGLHLIAALCALALAVLVAAVLRSTRARRQRRALHL